MAWNPADKGTSLTISGAANNIVTRDASAASNYALRSVENFTTGKYYFEAVTNGAFPTVDCQGIGIANSLNALNGGFIGGSANSSGLYAAASDVGKLYHNGVGTNYAALNNQATTTNIGVAVDVGAKKIWFRRNGGNWLAATSATQDPATNKGGFTYTTTGAIFAAATLNSPSTSFSANFRSASFTYTPPAGFAAMEITGTLAPTEARDTAALVGSASINGTLGPIEARDTAALVGGLSTTGTLAAPEGSDTAALVGSAATIAAFTGAGWGTSNWTFGPWSDPTPTGPIAVPEAPDTASLVGSLTTTGTLAATEARDTATLVGSVATLAALAAPEAQDTAQITLSVSVFVTLTGDLAAIEAPDQAALRGNADTAGTLATSENPDTPAITLWYSPRWSPGLIPESPDWGAGVLPPSPAWSSGAGPVSPSWSQGARPPSPAWSPGQVPPSPDWATGAPWPDPWTGSGATPAPARISTTRRRVA